MSIKHSDLQKHHQLDDDTANTVQSIDVDTLMESEAVAYIDSEQLIDLSSFVTNMLKIAAATGRKMTLRQASDVFRRMADGLKLLSDSHEGDSTLNEVS